MSDLYPALVEAGVNRFVGPWLEPLAADGDLEAVRALMLTSEYESRHLEAASWARRAVGLGDAEARWSMALYLEKAGQSDAAAEQWSALAQGGDSFAMVRLADHYRSTGDERHTVSWLEKAAEQENTAAIVKLTRPLIDTGRLADAARIWLSADSKATIGARRKAVELYERAGESEQAVAVWAELADEGKTEAMFELGVLSRRLGDLVGAEAWLRWAAGADWARARAELCDLLEQNGRSDEAEQEWRAAVTAGDLNAVISLAQVVERVQGPDAARAVLEEQARLGNGVAMVELATRCSDAPGEAERWLKLAISADSWSAVKLLAALLEESGRHEEDARVWLQAAKRGSYRTDPSALYAALVSSELFPCLGPGAG